MGFTIKTIIFAASSPCLSNVWHLHIHIRLVLRDDANIAAKTRNLTKKGWVTLHRQLANGPVIQLIGWSQWKASAVIQSIVLLKARCRRQHAALCEAQTNCLDLFLVSKSCDVYQRKIDSIYTTSSLILFQPQVNDDGHLFLFSNNIILPET